MNYLIIPDPHEEHEKLSRILAKYKPEAEHTVFLGDWYDQWGELNLYDVKETAKIHFEALHDPNCTVIRGNHDMPYEYKRIGGLKCSGHNPFKYETIDSIITRDDWNKSKFYTWANGWLLSHAGVHNWYLENKNPHDVLAELNEQCLDKLFNGESHFLLEAGRARGGFQKFGGITWLDFNREFQPVQNLNQIVGHTKGEIIKMKHSEALNSKNYCIDTGLNHIAIINENKTVTIIDVSEV